MKLGLGFSYWNSAKEIPRSLKPWLPHVDYIVAVDGRYWTPESPEMKKMNIPNFSTDNSFEVLQEICGYKLFHDKLYAPQMEKRQLCLDIAGDLDCDFMIVWDSDDYIHPQHQDFVKFKGQLESVLKWWDDDLFYMQAWIPDEKLWPRQHNAGIPDNSWKEYTRIHKNPGNQRYTKNHFTFTKKDVTDKQIYEWEWDENNWIQNEDENNPTLNKQLGIQVINTNKVLKMPNPFLLHPHIIIDGVRITTDRKFRSQEQLTFGDGWAWQNAKYEDYMEYLLAAKHVGLKMGLEDYEYFFDENGKRQSYNKDGTVMTPEQVTKAINQETSDLILKKVRASPDKFIKA